MYFWEKKNEQSGQMLNSARFLLVVERDGNRAEEIISSETCTSRWIHTASLRKQKLLTRLSLN